MRRTLALLSTLLALSACERGDRDLPASYRQIEVPDAQLTSVQARDDGRALFLEYCSLCHGRNADGHGERREGFARPPADFTDPNWLRRTTPRHVYHAVREGVVGTAMPAWKGALTPEQTWDVVAYLLSVSHDADR